MEKRKKNTASVGGGDVGVDGALNYKICRSYTNFSTRLLWCAVVTFYSNRVIPIWGECMVVVHV